ITSGPRAIALGKCIRYAFPPWTCLRNQHVRWFVHGVNGRKFTHYLLPDNKRIYFAYRVMISYIRTFLVSFAQQSTSVTHYGSVIVRRPRISLSGKRAIAGELDRGVTNPRHA
ncbi:hypothetical protein ACLOJK_008080, partial [Asimina triloba]